jgi:hypothetical protein
VALKYGSVGLMRTLLMMPGFLTAGVGTRMAEYGDPECP